MIRSIHILWFMAVVIGIRLLAMDWMPLRDTTEARYGEVALLMFTTNDWITPWFAPDVPFWGKPPLSFWAQALSFKLFGVSEFAARLPALLVTLATVWLTWCMARTAVPRAPRDMDGGAAPGNRLALVGVRPIIGHGGWAQPLVGCPRA